ncbi:hypothetical protein A1O1_08392 [Capronia coronata CBS 617.96]|uniref:Uncharacterized protein n=1 Tax=Capronia coronata CBS 617.96 TaxID=1182541 RepID=W9XSC8_9EURO|nr:uncharacterized protein A1O1_08392 [Capronia coronata CBS 617.96]EXJ80250.1 hypothetical protein A1O1_08392 [Capronia coronata CBS 617.96]
MMAGNQYHQQWQQDPAPVQQQYQYGRRVDQRPWQETGRSQGSYNQEYPQYNEYPKSRNGYGQGPVPTSSNIHEQNWRWEGQGQYPPDGYHDPYAGDGARYQQAPAPDPHHDQGHSSSRAYQYDDRYRNNGHRRPPMESEHSGFSDHQKPPRHQRSEPPTPHKRAKGRERILAQPTSPKNLAWDNPFGAFPAKKSSADRDRRASLDNGLNNLTIDDRRHSGEHDSRPHTSHGQRGPRKEVPRPSTSHSRPPEMAPPPSQAHQFPPARGSLDTTRPRQYMGSDTAPPPSQDYRMMPRQNSSDTDRSRQDFTADMRRGPLPHQDYQAPPKPEPSDMNYARQNVPSNTARAPLHEYQRSPGRGSSATTRQHQNMTSEMARPPLQDYQSAPGRGSSDASRQRPDLSANMGRPPFQDYIPAAGRGPPDPTRRQNARPQVNSPPMFRSETDAPRGPPPPPASQDRSRPMPYGSMPNPQSQGGMDFPGRQNPQRPPPNEYYGHDERYAQNYVGPSAPYESPSGPPPSRPPPRSISQENYANTGYRAGPPNNVPLNRPRSKDMPNYDAIPPRANERPEDHIIPGQTTSYDPQIYRRPTYQVSREFPGQADTAQNIPSRPDHPTSPLAEFSFDLPPNVNARPMTPSRYGDSTPVPSRQEYADRRTAEMRQPPVRGYEAEMGPKGPSSQYPPRAASRNGMKPPVGVAPPLPVNAPGYGSFDQGQPPVRPHTSNAQQPSFGSYDVGNPYDQEYPEYPAPSAPAVSGSYEQAYNRAAGANQPVRPPYGQGAPPRKGSEDNHNPGGLRPSTSNSAHPVPVRHYPGVNTNGGGSAGAGAGGNSSVVNINASVNPDALPAHPEPVRPGLNNGYAATPPPAQAGSGPKQATAPTPAPASGNATPQVTVQELTNLRQMYSQRPVDHALGLKLAKRLVDGAKVLSDEGGKADAKQTQKNRERYIFDAHKLVKKLVAANYPEAMFYLADCHGQGLLGLQVDAKEAFHLYQSAAKLNHAPSAYRVAVCCELGSEEGGGTRRDPMKAMQWYKRAATLGDTPAMYKMGMILLKGLLGQAKNPREGVSWLKRAAERADKDNPHALHELGLLYASVTPLDNIVRDEEYAFQLFQQAAELGYKYSQFRLGSAFEYGLLGCPIDPRQSIAWYTRAASQGEHQSELALSGWYLTGSEPLLTQSDTEAYLWARKAASSGLAKAEYAMGYFNEVGIGTAVDVEEARRWYYRAAAQNYAKARERLEEIKRGQKMSKTRVSRSNVNRQSDGECVVM